ncbi:MAG: 3-deoxy-D-manno-octulosonic acid transferase [Candidatus Schekmanbacteria bacterium]|nr:3-deoxy-D-manno-octulosonic acid transferase [Candidatus Schekmanbacteria bacterium]
MYIIYEILTWLFFIISLPYFAFKYVTTEKYRAGLKQRLGFIPPQKPKKPGAKRVWIHAVSVGETMAAMSLVKNLKEKHTNIEIIFSTTTLTGNKTAKQKLPEADSIIYFPLDFSWAVKRALKKVAPDICVLIETEIWPNFLRLSRKANIPVIISNGRLSENSCHGYMKLGAIIKRILQDISVFSMQSESDAKRIKEIGAPADRVVVTGNLKFDQAVISARKVDSISVSQTFRIPPEKFKLVFASTHKGEHDILIEVFLRLQKEFKDIFLVIAPRHPERFSEVDALLKSKGLNYVRRSWLVDAHQNKHDVLLIDSVGELYMIFAACDLVFMGGSLVSTGGHNLLEAAVFNKPVIFGPYMHNFRDIAGIILESEAGIQVKDKDELMKKLKSLLSGRSEVIRMGENCHRVFEKNLGATERNVDIIEKLLGIAK